MLRSAQDCQGKVGPNEDSVYDIEIQIVFAGVTLRVISNSCTPDAFGLPCVGASNCDPRKYCQSGVTPTEETSLA